MSAKLRLVSFMLCPFVQRSVITLEHKGIDYEIDYIDLMDPPAWFHEISPLGKVPLLCVGDQVLFESAVINEYLDEITPPSLHPADPLEKAMHRAWIEFSSDLFMAQFRMMTTKSPEEFDKLRGQIRSNLERLETVVKPGPYYAGETLSLVDTAYAPFFMRVDLVQRRHPLGFLDGLPNLQTWSAALLGTPAVQRSVVGDFEQIFVRRYGAEDTVMGPRLHTEAA